MMEWNRVTWYSKLGAVILFLGVVPALTFYIGTQYQETLNVMKDIDVSKSNESVKIQPKVVQQEQDVAVSGFYSPKGGEHFNFGDKITIKWDPSLIDASTIYLICTDTTTCTSGSQIYHRDDLADPVSKIGSLSYVIPTTYMGLEPGRYKVRIFSYREASRLESQEFIINQPNETAPRARAEAIIQSISGQKTSYAPGEAINLFVDARDWDGVAASQDLGFNIQAHTYDTNNYPGPSYQAVNASYNSASKLWQIVMSAPTDKTKIYSLQIALYCGYGGNSVCLQEHGNSSQIEKTISFTVK